MEKQSYLNKKGISEMVSYTLLIIIAVGLSAVVFIYLKLYIPKEKPECPEDTSILIKEVSCKSIYSTESDQTPSKTELYLTIYNNGLHKIDAAYIKYAKGDKKALFWLNDPDKISPENFYFYDLSTDKKGLQPSESKSYLFQLSPLQNREADDYTLEVQPARFSKNIISSCKSILSQKFSCIKTIAPASP